MGVEIEDLHDVVRYHTLRITAHNTVVLVQAAEELIPFSVFGTFGHDNFTVSYPQCLLNLVIRAIQHTGFDLFGKILNGVCCLLHNGVVINDTSAILHAKQCDEV